MKKRLFVGIVYLIAVLTMHAQMVDPVHFSTAFNMLKSNEAEIVFSATIAPGWHVYSTDLGQDGPIEATLSVVRMDGAETVGKLMPRGNIIKHFDNMFGMELKYFEQTATFVQKIRFTKPQYTIECYLEYGACNDEMCMPPSQVEFKKSGEYQTANAETEKASEKDQGAKEKNGDVDDEACPTETCSLVEDSVAASDTIAATTDSILSTKDVSALSQGGVEDESLLYILLMGFVGGLLAVCMPCIWPIIPMTVSFFLKRAKDDRRRGVRDAVTYGVSIIVIYLGLGLLATALFGSDTLNAMSTNAVFNIFLFVLLVVFALSFFGWFEIKLPDSWANKMDQKSEELSAKAGANVSRFSFFTLFSIFLMAFTLVLVSFSCTAPIIGLLLVETTMSGNWLAPALGMLGFAVALALPFTLFAMFPSWLKQTPKSGAWMNTIKVVLGFIELAFALKFFSVADLAYGWHLLDREVFLSLWIVIFGLLGAYLLGWLKFQSDDLGGKPNRPMPVLCIMGGLVSLAFAVYMIPGLWGAPCKAVSAFAPPMNTQDFNLNTKTVEARFTDYDAGMAAARAEGKPVLVDFTGFGCVNCRKMEAAVWTDPRVASLLTKDFVLISLYVDDKTHLAEPLIVTDAQGNEKTLRTVGAKWSYLQSSRFGANAQPYYVMLDNEGKPLVGSRAYNEDVEAYINFLKEGLKKFRKAN